MAILVLGASGATGKHLVEQLISAGQKLKIIIRPSSKIPDSWLNNNQVQVIHAPLSAMNIDEMAQHIADCQAVASCLGHNMTWKGIYGKPRLLVTDTIALACQSILKNKPEQAVKVILMNTAGNSNRDLKEPVSGKEKLIIGLIRKLLPPHTDNEKAADYLRTQVGQSNPYIEWAVVRPDNLLDEEKVTEYTAHLSPTRSAIFNPGKTSRINVAHFMASLITNIALWDKWKGRMPVVYNAQG